MATTTELLTSVPSRDVMANGIFYQCRRPSPLSIPWAFNKRAQKRHSSSFSLFDSSVLGSKVVETVSLPSTPIPFFGVEGSKKKRFWEDFDCCEDGAGFASSSESSGYSSGYSSEDSSTRSTSESSSYGSSIQESKDLKIPEISIPSEAIPIYIEENSQEQPEERVEEEGKSSYSTLPVTAECSQCLSASPLSDVTSSSIGNSNSPIDSVPSRLISVSVPSKRSSSESSTSSAGSAIIDETPRQRVKDEEGFIRRAACVCVNQDESKVVLISSKYEGGGWLVPGGGLESGEGEEEAAVREAWEEAGIKGKVKRCLGVFQSEDEATHKKKRTAVYVLDVSEQHGTYPESGLGRTREWFTVEKAIHHLSQCKPHQIAYLRAL